MATEASKLEIIQQFFEGYRTKANSTVTKNCSVFKKVKAPEDCLKSQAKLQKS